MRWLRRIADMLSRQDPAGGIPPRDPNLVPNRVHATTEVLTRNTLLRAELAALEGRLRRQYTEGKSHSGVAR